MINVGCCMAMLGQWDAARDLSTRAQYRLRVGYSVLFRLAAVSDEFRRWSESAALKLL